MEIHVKRKKSADRMASRFSLDDLPSDLTVESVLSRMRNAELTANLLDKIVVHLGMSGYRSLLSRHSVDEHGMVAPFPINGAALTTEIPYEKASLHATATLR